jgi:hypothetical protein
VFRFRHLLCIASLLLSGVSFLPAQAPTDSGASSPQDATAPEESKPWSVGNINFSGLVDGYYSLNFNHPASGVNVLRNFDVRANELSLNMAKLTLSHAPEPVGFQLDLGFGRAFEIFHATEPGGVDVYRNIQQAYVSLKPTQLKGLQIDFGKFVTSAGAEPTETHLNYNYSRSLIYANGPYYHFGLRTAMPVNDYLTVGFQVVNGWNNVEDNNSGKTIGLTSALTVGNVTWANNYYVGPEQAGTNEARRHFYDTVLSVNSAAGHSAYFNFDYGKDRILGGPSVSWVTVGGAARFKLNDQWAISPRLEWYNDRDGFITGTAQEIKEFTLTGEYKIAKGFFTRLEYRRDWSDQPFFDRGNERGNWKTQDTITIGMVAFFGQ